MSFSTDKYLGRQFNQHGYTCLHFARDVWLELRGVDIIDRLHSLFVPVEIRRITRDHTRGFVELPSPKDPCIVLMQHPQPEPHLGIYYRGKILHLPRSGPEYLPLDIIRLTFRSVRFFDDAGHNSLEPV